MAISGLGAIDICTLHRKAMRGSGGVGVLIREEVLKQWVCGRDILSMC